MGWVELHHTKCNLPNSEQIKKVNAQPGSVWRCGDTGCGKTYILESDWNLIAIVNVETRYVQTGDELIPVEGLDWDDRKFAGLTSEQRQVLLNQEKAEKEEAARLRAERQAQLRMAQMHKLPPPPKPGVFERIFGPKLGE